MFEVILLLLVKLLIVENLHFANFIKLSALEQKVRPFIGIGGHLGSHRRFINLHMPEDITMYLIELLIYENI